MTAADRLRAAREAAGHTEATAAAEIFGWKVPTYLAHENGSRGLRPDVAAKYGRAYGVSPEWLLYGKGKADAPALPPSREALIPIYDVTASAGNGATLVEHELVDDHLSFPPDYLREITSTASRHLAIIRTKGDSMVPTIAEDDLVMVDTTKRDLSFDGIFVIRDDGASLLVKRIGRGTRRGHVMVISDNSRYAPAERPLGDIEVLGKVVWMGVRV
jgi:phage repressor protein C with HTH and peptisase S24 domain